MVGLAFPLVLVTGKESPVNTFWDNFSYRATPPCSERAIGVCQPLSAHWTPHWELVLEAGKLGLGL